MPNTEATPAATMAEKVVVEWLQAQADAIRVANPHLASINVEASSDNHWSISARSFGHCSCGVGSTLAGATADLLKSAPSPLARAAALRAEAARLEQEAPT